MVKKLSTVIGGDTLGMLKGDQGELGDQGDQGYQGETGLQGPPDGDQGDQGFQGEQGGQGFQGPPDGDQGTQGEQGAFTWVGPWTESDPYVVDDAVSNTDTSGRLGTYVCIQDNFGEGGYEPGGGGGGSAWENFWELMAQGGDPGSDGVQGDQGTQGPDGVVGSWDFVGGSTTLVLGDLKRSVNFLSDRIWTLPAVFSDSADPNWIWIYNGDVSGWDIILTPASGDELYVDGASLGVDVTYTLVPGDMAFIMAQQDNSEWAVTKMKGLKGDQGANGPQGFQGVDGADGDQGAQGDQGGTGSAGVQGAQGLTGSTGDQGTAGVQGAQGTQGASGMIGRFPNVGGNRNLVLGDKLRSSDHGSAQIWILPSTFDFWGDPNWLWVWNADDTYNINIRPGTGDDIRVDGVSLGADVDLVLTPGQMATIMIKTTDSTWEAKVW